MNAAQWGLLVLPMLVGMVACLVLANMLRESNRYRDRSAGEYAIQILAALFGAALIFCWVLSIVVGNGVVLP